MFFEEFPIPLETETLCETQNNVKITEISPNKLSLIPTNIH
jgi:hypothetical protein